MSSKDQRGRSVREQVRKFKPLRTRYEEYASILEQILQKAAKKHAPLAIVQARAKQIPSFAGKILRKWPQYKDAVETMTDLCGGRVITHTQTQVKAVSNFVRDHFEIYEGEDVGERLKPSEFGYQSYHYIVKIKPGVFPTPDINVKIPKRLHGLKAEIQIRTLLQHAWADIGHDLSYKSEIKIPAEWERAFAATAAVLEGADRSFSRIEDGLKEYAASYGAYMSEDQMREEIEKLKFVQKYDPSDSALPGKIGKLAITLGDWPEAIETLSEHLKDVYGSVRKATTEISKSTDTANQPLLRDLGVALCKKYARSPKGGHYKRGQSCLAAASAPAYQDSDALASLAGTWKGLDDGRVNELYRKAFEIDPTDPYPLVNYLDCEVITQRTTSVVSLLAPVIQAAIQRSQRHIDVGMNLPWAFYCIGKLSLLQKKPYQAFEAYCKAIQLSAAPFMIESALASIEKLAVVKKSLPGYEWIRRLLLLGLVVKFPRQAGSGRKAKLRRLASKNCAKMRQPVVIAIGGCDASVEKHMQAYRGVLVSAFSGFEGTIISGGSTSGIGGLVGGLQQKYKKALCAIGYLPSLLPVDAQKDNRYSDIRQTSGREGFTPLEPLQNWIDVVASGIGPASVKIIGINGGQLAAAEYQLALALGASVGVIADSGREAGRLVVGDDRQTLSRMIALPADGMTVRAFLRAGHQKLEPNIRETLGRAIHEEYRNVRMTEEMPRTAKWEATPENFKESNRQQADDILDKLDAINCEAAKTKDGMVSRPISFTKREIDIMARMEHARWNVERLLDGWRYGEKRNCDKKISPYVVPWDELSEEIRDYDRNTIRKIPEYLSLIGMEVRRRE